MKTCYFLLLLTLTLTLTQAEEKVCCFSDSFTMDGRFSFLFNLTDAAKSQDDYNRQVLVQMSGTLKTTANFARKQFSAVATVEASFLSINGRVSRLRRKYQEGKGNLTIILDAGGSEPRLYGIFNVNATRRKDKRGPVRETRKYGNSTRVILQKCGSSPVTYAERIPAYKCVPQQVFSLGESTDDQIRMLLASRRLPPSINEKLQIYFDKETCTPSKIIFEKFENREDSTGHVRAEFTADAKVGQGNFPSIPDDLSECEGGRTEIKIKPADEINDFLSFAAMMAGIRH